MFLIQLLLPTRQSETGALKPLIETRQELSERFKGPHAYVRAAAADVPADASQDHADGIAMVEVVTDAFDREWWRAYARTLAERFTTDRVRWRAVPIEAGGEV